jgi:hypothetical protein
MMTWMLVVMMKLTIDAFYLAPRLCDVDVVVVVDLRVLEECQHLPPNRLT